MYEQHIPTAVIDAIGHHKSILTIPGLRQGRLFPKKGRIRTILSQKNPTSKVKTHRPESEETALDVIGRVADGNRSEDGGGDRKVFEVLVRHGGAAVRQGLQ
jgi:hypothetical protein